MTPRLAERNLVVAALVGFGGLLRRLGIEVSPARLQTAAAALGAVDPGDRESVYWALRCTLLSRCEQGEAFDAAFAAFWDAIPLELLPAVAPSPPSAAGEEAEQEGEAARRTAGNTSLAEGADGDEEEREADPTPTGFSAMERLRAMDFRDYGPEELALARDVMRRLARTLPRRRSRRMRPASSGGYLDRHATLRSAMRSDGHPLELAWRRHSSTPRRLVFLVDISGSMAAYARPVLIFGQAACRASHRVEVLSFGTRLTRLTGELAGPDPARAMERAAEAVPDWAGGTRIGEAIERFNSTWGRRGASRGATVVIVSDGWERGDVSALRREMERLQRTAHTVIWVNPLAGDPGYEPLVAGMAAALPFVDVFLPGQDLRSLEALAALLGRLPDRRRRSGLGMGPDGYRGALGGNPLLPGRNPPPGRFALAGGGRSYNVGPIP